MTKKRSTDEVWRARKSGRLALGLLIGGLLMGGLLPGMASADIVYVDADVAASGDGSSWGQAKKTISEAILGAASGDLIWIAEGTYEEVVTLTTGVALYGGFNGTETLLSERSVDNHTVTIDVSTAAGGSPAYHAVWMQNLTGTRLDGVTITGADADNFGDDAVGGGIFGQNLDDTNVIANCKLTGNRAKSGAAMFLDSCFLTITGCTVYGNTIVPNPLEGGSPAIEANYSALQISDCEFYENSPGSGGGLQNFYTPSGRTTTVSYCTFRDNEVRFGGGIEWQDESLVVEHCLFYGNRVRYGGAIYILGSGANLTIRDCIIAGNRANYDGAGVFSTGGQQGAFNFDRTLFSGNRAGVDGGAMSLGALGALNLTNCILSGNRADGDGGAIWWSGSDPDVLNNVFSRNAAGSQGGGIYSYYTIGDPAFLKNNIFEGNTNGAFYETSYSGDTYADNNLFYNNPNGDFRDSSSGMLSGATAINAIFGMDDNVDGDPTFLSGPGGAWTAPPAYDANTNRTLLTDETASFSSGSVALLLVSPDVSETTQAYVTATTESTLEIVGDHTGYVASGDSYQLVDYHLKYPSMAVDYGTGSGAPSTDFDGNSRPFDVLGLGVDGTGTEFDIGPYEAQLVPEITVTHELFEFGSQHVDDGPTPSKEAIITNDGFSDLIFSGAGIEVTGEDADSFWLVNSPSTSPVIPGASRTVEVAFDPPTIPYEPKAAYLTITTNDSDESVISIPLSGNAFGPTGLPVEVFSDYK